MSHSKPPLKELKHIRKHWRCSICGIIYECENRRVAIFTVPKKKFASWQLLIPTLKQTSRLCDKHFDETDILKGLTVGQDFHPAERWRLTYSAFPKHFLSMIGVFSI